MIIQDKREIVGKNYRWPWGGMQMIPAFELDRLAKLAGDFLKEVLKKLSVEKVERAIILGTVMQEVLTDYELLYSLPLPNILPFNLPGKSAAGHKSVLEFRRTENEVILVCRGRTHVYEVLDHRKATFLVRVFHALGIKELILTNAAGTLTPKIPIKTFAFLENCWIYKQEDPLFGVWPKNGDLIYYDPINPFSPDMIQRFSQIASESNISFVNNGILAVVKGPCFEDYGQRVELASIANVVGMSVVNETTVFGKLGEVFTPQNKKIKTNRIIGITVATDECKPGMNLCHIEISEVAKEIQAPMNKILMSYYNNPLPILPVESEKLAEQILI